MNKKKTENKQPPICDYEGSDYQTRFWENGGREYEDRSEAIALKRLLPKSGIMLLELGAGAGRNTLRYSGFKRIVLLDYSRSQLKLAQELLGTSDRFIYVAADIYHLPFKDGLFDAATMIRVLHHMADAPKALRQVDNVLQPGGCFILEFANKRNWKSILRYWFHRQSWNPFTPEPVEFVPLNFDFHPRGLRTQLEGIGFRVERILPVSHFRVGLLKRTVPPTLLAYLDSILQWTGRLGQFSPSIFLRLRKQGEWVEAEMGNDPAAFFKCPECGCSPLAITKQEITCTECKRNWKIADGIFDFRGNVS